MEAPFSQIRSMKQIILFVIFNVLAFMVSAQQTLRPLKELINVKEPG